MSPGPWLLTWGSPASPGPVRGGRWRAEPLCDRSSAHRAGGPRAHMGRWVGAASPAARRPQPEQEGQPLSSEAFVPSPPSPYQEVPVEVREAFLARGPLERRRGLPGWCECVCRAWLSEHDVPRERSPHQRP